jgi:hypothetical protein
MLETVWLPLFVMYLSVVMGIKVIVLFQYLCMPTMYVTGKETIKCLLIAWVWPIYILLGFFWANEMNRWIHKP